MVVSMTGFATKTITLSNKQTHTQVTLSLKSLNSRYFEATCKLPYALIYLETDIVKLLKKKLYRGTIFFLVQMNNQNVFKGQMHPDLDTIKSYLTAIEKIKNVYDISGDVTINDLISLPNIFSAEEQIVDNETKNIVFNAVNDLIDQLINTRLIEGAALEKDLLERTETMSKNIKAIEKLAEKLMQQKKEEVNQKLSELGSHSQEFIKMQRETFYLELDKIDIHEEIVRFKNHLVTFKKNLESEEQEKGRHLDFILQELAREVNTIAAKCGDSDISLYAINIKVEVEKAREQIQNIV